MISVSKLWSRDVFPDPLAALPAQSSSTSLTVGMRAILGRRSSTRCSGILDAVRTHAHMHARMHARTRDRTITHAHTHDEPVPVQCFDKSCPCYVAVVLLIGGWIEAHHRVRQLAIRLISVVRKVCTGAIKEGSQLKDVTRTQTRRRMQEHTQAQAQEQAHTHA